MELETNRLKIIPCTADSVVIAQDRNYDLDPHITSYLEELAADSSLLYWGCWFVVRKSDGEVIGDIGFKGKPDKNKVVEVGYGLLEEYWNKGYATEAVGALIHWALNTPTVERVKAETLQNNHGSIRVLEKLGMKKVGETESMYLWET
ncbi:MULTISPECIES: GNAT family N-acetyltransferase [Bacillaceae]|uniref:GNAT family N-acetyltransferase n=1 Tax=Evansella alkalicola TaxID=745819 RepID=A0ABS6JVY1_9BACI|nr:MULTISPECIES: GNAT family N-acetyltransferase [Bacillaceae]MBU9722747.1 GNAT family N-acetyltransferase [Bacillus alkalicola]